MKRFIEFITRYISIIIIVFTLVLCVGIAYLISISNMPDWLKFYLLSR